MVVALTIGLSIVSKSITNVKTTTEEANSAQALAAAEAGVAQAIQTNSGIASPSSYSNNASFTSTLTQLSGQTITVLNGGTVVPQDEGADLWLVPHKTDGTPDFTTPWAGSSMNIYWGDPDPSISCPNQAALEILIIKAPATSPTSARYAVDPCSARVSPSGNNFSSPTETRSSASAFSIGGKSFLYRYSISSSNVPPFSANSGLIARIVPLYTNAIISVADASTPAAPFPSQGVNITATGKANDTTIQRKLNVFQGFSYMPIEYVTYGISVHR